MKTLLLFLFSFNLYAATVGELVDARPRSFGYEIKKDSDGSLYKVNRLFSTYVMFEDGSTKLKSESGYSIPADPELSAEALVHLRRVAGAAIITAFQVEDAERYKAGTITLAHLDEMLDNADLKKLERRMRLGRLDKAYATLLGMATNTTWLTQERKDTYVNKILAALAELQ